jgi:rhodanese-related sulfurtransferase
MKLNFISAVLACLLGSTAYAYAQPQVANTQKQADNNSNPVIAETAFTPYAHMVDFAFVKAHATIPPRDDVLIIDSRSARKFNSGHIPAAINISQSQFAQHTDQLPKDKSTLLIFYCGGLKCPLSHKAARQAEALGYTSVRVYAAGYPDWLEQGGYPDVTAAYVKKASDKAVIVDARPPRKYNKGHIPGAINVPTTRFATMQHLLPTDKTVELIFYCGGYECPLSRDAADKAKALGYINLKLYQAGYPDWNKKTAH